MLQDIPNQEPPSEKITTQSLQPQYTNSSHINDVITLGENFSQEMLSDNCQLPISPHYYHNKTTEFLNNSYIGDSSFTAFQNTPDYSNPIIYQKLINNGFIPFHNDQTSPFANKVQPLDYRQTSNSSFNYYNESGDHQNFHTDDTTNIQSNISSLICPSEFTSSLNQSNGDLDQSNNGSSQISNFDIQQDFILFNLDQTEDQKLREREQNAVMWFEQFRNATNTSLSVENGQNQSISSQMGEFADVDLINSNYYPQYQMEMEQIKENAVNFDLGSNQPNPQTLNNGQQHSLKRSKTSSRYTNNTFDYSMKTNDLNFYDNRSTNNNNSKMSDTSNNQNTSNDSSTGALTTTVYFWQYNAQCKGPKAVKLVGEGVDSPLGSSSPSSYDMSTSGISRSSLSYCPIASQSLPGYPLVVFEDPVQKRQDLVHCSKLRRGDGNDVTPNINRLRSMGEELDRLSGQIARQGEIIMTGGMSGSNSNSLSGILSHSPGNIRIDQGSLAALDPASAIEQSWCVEEAKREKNKLASKICRLKKKAFHESNKIKYTGLGLEYGELSSLYTQLKQALMAKAGDGGSFNDNNSSFEQTNNGPGRKRKRNEKSNQEIVINPDESLYGQAIRFKSSIHTTHVAGRTDPFVEEVLVLSRSNQTRSSLLKRLSSGNQLTSTISLNNNSNSNNGTCYSENSSRSATPNSISQKSRYSNSNKNSSINCQNSCLMNANAMSQQQQQQQHLQMSHQHFIDFSANEQGVGNNPPLDYLSFDIVDNKTGQLTGSNGPIDLTQINHHFSQQQSSEENGLLYQNYQLITSTTDRPDQQEVDGIGSDKRAEGFITYHQPSDTATLQNGSIYEIDPNEAAAVVYLSSAQNSLINNQDRDYNQLMQTTDRSANNSSQQQGISSRPFDYYDHQNQMFSNQTLPIPTMNAESILSFERTSLEPDTKQTYEDKQTNEQNEATLNLISKDIRSQEKHDARDKPSVRPESLLSS